MFSIYIRMHFIFSLPLLFGFPSLPTILHSAFLFSLSLGWFFFRSATSTLSCLSLWHRSVIGWEQNFQLDTASLVYLLFHLLASHFPSTASNVITERPHSKAALHSLWLATLASLHFFCKGSVWSFFFVSVFFYHSCFGFVVLLRVSSCALINTLAVKQWNSTCHVVVNRLKRQTERKVERGRRKPESA